MSTNTDTSGSTVSTITNISTSSVFDINNLMYLYQPSTNVSSITDGSGSDPSGNVPFSIQDLINSQQVIINKENEDKINALAFVNLSIDSIKPQLYNWASAGFPVSYGVSSLSLTPPAVCSDGQTRNLMEYFTWLIQMTTEQWIYSMDLKTTGMYFTYSHNGNSYINLHISKGPTNILY